jgi:hypothetical protein
MLTEPFESELPPHLPPVACMGEFMTKKAFGRKVFVWLTHKIEIPINEETLRSIQSACH